ncbi:MAG TPA: hypothetical protein VGJ60_06885 [Chloroflexota bacterium]|jgi:hypothetical protein
MTHALIGFYWRVVCTLVTACAVASSIGLPLVAFWLLASQPVLVRVGVSALAALILWPNAVFLLLGYRRMLGWVSPP